MNQVKRVVVLKHNLFYRQLHNAPQPNILYPLESRKLLKVGGPDASGFLQGLITNDMKHFDEGAKSMYAMFLNNKGRVLYDTLIHKSENMFLLECDKKVLSLLLRHLRIYKLRRNVEFGDTNHFKLWALIASPETLPEANDDKENIQIYKDPRLEGLGYRILSHVSVKDDTIHKMFKKKVNIENEVGYKELRYKLGVSEGPSDLPPGTCFPLEANCDYLHGVSFHKGCYIGQELTARVHHTGVVRKRIMPLQFSEEVTGLAENCTISAGNKPKSNFGKVRGYINNLGIGLVRIKEALEASELVVGNYTVKIDKPSWWPIEAPKEKVTLVE